MNKALGLIGLAARARKIVCGTDSCIDAMKKNKIKLLIISEEASDKTKKNLKYYAEKNNVKNCFFETTENLSKAIGKKNKVVLGILDESLAKEIQNKINGGEVIG